MSKNSRSLQSAIELTRQINAEAPQGLLSLRNSLIQWSHHLSKSINRCPRSILASIFAVMWPQQQTALNYGVSLGTNLIFYFMSIEIFPFLHCENLEVIQLPEITHFAPFL